MSGLRADLGLTRGDFTLGIALGVAPGETVALLGPNGAGKTTAIELLAGLAALDSGRIELNDTVFDEANAGTFVGPDERNIGIVFQDHSLFPHLDALDNAAFGLRARGHSKRDARTVAQEWLDRLDIGDIAAHAPNDLSGGESQRVALARAFATSPDLLLLDEPFAALDASTRVATRRVFAEHLTAFEGPTLIITHDPSEAFLLADAIHVIEDGSITQSGTSDEIRTRPNTEYIADLAGVNLLTGTAINGDITVGGHHLRSADTTATGPVIATIHPRAISVHRERPEGSPRNTWETTVMRSEHYGDRVRLQFGVPIDLTAEITPEAESSLSIDVGSIVWVSIKATEVSLQAR
jgi:molybdate transport system ATP-binding protein